MKSGYFRLEWLDRYREYAPFFLRALIGAFVIWEVQDNVLSYARMEEFARFLAARGTPAPLFSAFLSIYTQLICGSAIMLGAYIRIFSIPFIINFIFAVIIAHLGDTFRGMFPALVMIASGCYFLLSGAGKLSVDDLLANRRKGTIPITH